VLRWPSGCRRPGRYVDVPPDAYRRALAGVGLPGWLVDRLIELNTMMAAAHAAGVTDEVAMLMGRQLRTTPRHPRRIN
jgi:hypothetical protein